MTPLLRRILILSVPLLLPDRSFSARAAVEAEAVR
jgi:hypothetical protein